MRLTGLCGAVGRAVGDTICWFAQRERRHERSHRRPVCANGNAIARAPPQRTPCNAIVVSGTTVAGTDERGIMTANNMRDDWWKQAVVYQIYPRSFKDVNGDGLGDIAGVTEKMDYLKNLGIDAIWLSPFYPSDLADGGYDVIDYRNVDPRLGTMADFDAMAAAAHEAGIKVIVDIVPNHTSNKHKMFIEALAAGRGSAARDRYIFRDGRGEHGELPPNDWQSLFGGPAWQQVDDGQWYLHMFAKEQPDLNWKNPDVHEEFKKR